jgi:hypothetical protein
VAQGAFRKGVGSNPTGVIFLSCDILHVNAQKLPTCTHHTTTRLSEFLLPTPKKATAAKAGLIKEAKTDTPPSEVWSWYFTASWAPAS